MTIQKLSLEQWFTNYQLAAVRRRHFHLPMEVAADISLVLKEWRKKNSGEPPYTALLTKAVGILASEMPHVNRAVFSTFYGPRLIQFERVVLNMPIIVPADGRDHLSAILIQDPQKLSLDEIRGLISAGRKRDINKMPFGRFLVRSGNYFWNRAILRLVHFLVFQFPAIYVRFGGGGVSVSSLLNHRGKHFNGTPHAAFHTAFTFCSFSAYEAGDGRTIMNVGINWDHYAASGNELGAAIRRFSDILSGEDPTVLMELIR